MIAVPSLWFGGRGNGASGRTRPVRRSETPASATLDEQHPDFACVARVRASDRAAFDAMVADYFALLARYAFGVVQSRDDAEDVVQEVLADVWVSRATWMPRHGIRAYLFTAVRYRALNRTRRVSVESRYTTDITPRLDDEQPTDHAALEHDAARVLAQALGQLSDRARQAVLLRYTSDCTGPEVAQILGLSLAATQKLLQRTLQQLRQRLTTLR